MAHTFRDFEDLLICPSCRSRLGRRGDLLVCHDSSHVFPIVQDVPILLDKEERERIDSWLGTAALMRRRYKRNVSTFASSWVRKAIGSTLHLPAGNAIKQILREVGWELSLEIGSGSAPSRRGWVNLDIGVFRGVNVVASALSVPFENETFGFVRNIAVLEHVEDPVRVVQEIHRVLKPGGYVYTEVPFLQHFHSFPCDYQRYTREGLTMLFRDFEEIETGVCVGPGSALTAMAADWLELFSFTENGIINGLLRTVPLIMMLPLKYFDYLLVKNPRCHEVASGIYTISRKPALEEHEGAGWSSSA